MTGCSIPNLLTDNGRALVPGMGIQRSAVETARALPEIFATPFADKFKTPTLVVHGQNDYRLDVSEGFQLFTTLQRLKVPSKMLYFPDEGHWVIKPQNSRLWYKTVNDWVDQWCK